MRYQVELATTAGGLDVWVVTLRGVGRHRLVARCISEKNTRAMCDTLNARNREIEEME